MGAKEGGEGGVVDLEGDVGGGGLGVAVAGEGRSG